MQHAFSLFQSHLDLAHAYWQRLLLPGDWAIDATCGNGHDTLKLATILGKSGGSSGSGLIALDIQEEALVQTRALLDARDSHPQSDPTSITCKLAPVHLFHQSHVEFPPLASMHPIRLVVYNLGYLPRGNKALTTAAQTTLASVHRAMSLIQPGGALSITCYPGHPEGAQELEALIAWSSKLPSSGWSACWHTFANRTSSPQLLLLQRAL